MRILFDHQIFSAQQYGGVSRYFYELAKYISVKGSHEVEIFAPLHVNEYLGMASDIRIFSMKMPYFRSANYVWGGINATLSWLMVKSRKDIDVFHETYFSRTDNCPRSAKRLITVYDMVHEKFSQDFPARHNFQKIKAHAINRADHIICISENTRRDLIEILGVPEEKTSVVYLGCSLLCGWNSIQLINHRKPFILYVGTRRYGYKNYELLLRAYSSSKLLQNEVSIICFGGGKATAREKSLIASLNLPPDCVQFMGGDDRILAGLYTSAKAFVYPSLYEGFGIPPLEAMAIGCPVVCSNTSSIPEVVGNAAELFDPYSESDMRAAIEKTVFSQLHAASLVARGRDRIKIFSWEKCSKDTMAVYEKILGV
jgi:glycosyltransferase involved in cell wall biosynthesis